MNVMMLRAMPHHRCGELKVLKDRNENRTDEAGRQHRARINKEEEVHDAEHKGERAYFDKWLYQAEKYPSRCTALNIDAPTQHQFDLPWHRRISSDIIKSLDGARRWQSKITGYMVAGMGMSIYAVRTGIGSGPNVVLTCAMHGLTSMAKA
eukprot:5752138-Pleurochrysis_carterae.AAC.1